MPTIRLADLQKTLDDGRRRFEARRRAADLTRTLVSIATPVNPWVGERCPRCSRPAGLDSYCHHCNASYTE